MEEVKIYPNHQYQHLLPHHHSSHSGCNPIDPNQCLPEHQQRPEALLEITYAEVPVEGHFYSDKKCNYLEFYLTISTKRDKITI